MARTKQTARRSFPTAAKSPKKRLKYLTSAHPVVVEEQEEKKEPDTTIDQPSPLSDLILLSVLSDAQPDHPLMTDAAFLARVKVAHDEALYAFRTARRQVSPEESRSLAVPVICLDSLQDLLDDKLTS